MTAIQVLLCVWCLVAMSGCASLSATGEQRVNPTAAAIKEFDDRVQAYRELHSKLEAKLNDPIEASQDAGKIAAGEKRLTIAVQQARKGARQGDIFTPAVAPVFRDIVTRYFDGENPKLDTAPQDRPPAMSVKINERWPETVPVPTMAPTLLANLPKLPEDMAYRFADRTLVLMDVDTDLIIDYLPYASRPPKK